MNFLETSVSLGLLALVAGCGKNSTDNKDNNDKLNKDREISTLKNQIGLLNQQKTTLVQEQKEKDKNTDEQMKNMKNMESNLTNELDLKEQELAESNKNIATTREIKEKLQIELNEVNSNFEKIKIDAQNSIQLKKDLEVALAQKQKELEVASTSLNTTIKIKQDLEIALTQKQKELEVASSKLNETLKLKQEVEIALTKKQQELEKANTNLNVAIAKLSKVNAELNKVSAELKKSTAELNELTKKQAKINEFISTSFSQFRGLWVVENGDGNNVDINQDKCKIFMRVDADIMQVSRIIACEDKRTQIDNYSFSEMVPHYDSTTSRNSLSITLKSDSSSCGSNHTHLPESKNALFLDNQEADNTDRVGSYAALMFGSKTVYLNSGSNIPALLRTSNCKVIIKSATENPDVKILQLAKNACELDTQTEGSGCFVTTNDFIAVH